MPEYSEPKTVKSKYQLHGVTLTQYQIEKLADALKKHSEVKLRP